MADQRLVTRRKFLKIAGGALGAGVVTCGGGAWLGMRTPSSVTFAEAPAQGGGGKKVLVAYASKCGATAEVAEAVAEALRAGGLNAALMKAGNVRSLEGYQGVVLGSAIYMGNPLKEAADFMQEFGSRLADKPLALFDVCLTMKEAGAENEKTALDYLSTLAAIQVPVKVGAFAGRIAHASLPPLYRMFAQADSEGTLAEGDFRDWEAIGAWAKDLAVVMADYS